MSKALSILTLASALLFGAVPGHAALTNNALFENALDWNGIVSNALETNRLDWNGFSGNALDTNATATKTPSQGNPAQLHIIAVELPKSH